MAFANGLLMSVPSFLWTECNNRVSQQNQPNTKKLKQQALMKHMRLKKQTVLKSYMRWKRKKRKNIWDSKLYFTSEAKIYLLSKNIIYHKTLKRQKKANVAKTMDCGLFFLVKQISSFCFKKKMYINGGVKKKRYQRWSEKKRYQRWCEKHNDFFGNFFIILASNTNFVSKNLNLRRPTKISLKNLFFLAKQHILFVSEENLFFFDQNINVEGFALNSNTQCCCCKCF